MGTTVPPSPSKSPRMATGYSLPSVDVIRHSLPLCNRQRADGDDRFQITYHKFMQQQHLYSRTNGILRFLASRKDPKGRILVFLTNLNSDRHVVANRGKLAWCIS